MKTIAIIGGSGGLGKQVTDYFSEQEKCIDFQRKSYVATYNVISLSSKDLDVRDYKKVWEFFYDNDIDIVINLSGVNHDRMIHKLGQEDQYKVNHLLDVNLHGSINIASACLPLMRERGYGRLIYISSVLSTHVVPGTGLYSSCKAFIDRLVKNISAENISKGITCNSIQLGYFQGGLTDKLPDPEKIKQSLPLKRWGTISELCSTIEFLINNEYITGVNLPVNGGI